MNSFEMTPLAELCGLILNPRIIVQLHTVKLINLTPENSLNLKIYIAYLKNAM